MKKIYMVPALQVNEAEVQNIMAVSIINEDADPDKDVLTKEDKDWDFWGEEEQ